MTDTYLGHPAEFDTLFRATNSLINSFHQIYHPLIAEFLSTKHAFDTLEFQSRCLQMVSLEDTWPSAYERKAGLQEVIQKERAAALQLLSLRKQCVFEGLGDNLELVMSETGVSEYDFKLWESLTLEDHRYQEQLQLGGLKSLNLDEQRKDRLTRANEWMLGVFNASSYLIDLHRQIMTSEIDRRLRITALKEYKSGEPSSSVGIIYWEGPYGSTYETMRRAIVKFWFLDSAAMSEEEYPSSRVTNSDSDATFQRLEVEDESLDDLIQSHGMEPSTTISRDPVPVVNLLNERWYGILLASLEEWKTVDLPPDGISNELQAAAQKAVVAYRQEPSHAYDD